MTLGDQPLGREGFLHGKLLIAMPGMPDPRFDKSVIFICSHSEQGAFGLILNKPIDELSFKSLMEKMDIPTTPQTSTRPVLLGGPVDTDSGYILHSNEAANRPPSTITVTPEIALTLTVDLLRKIAGGRGPDKWLMALGYAGWGPGQIESEMASNGWIHCDADDMLVFDEDFDGKWAKALGKLGASLSGLSSEVGRA
ncbi:MAG: YqgE/AlgH family protein [Rhizomicrobium sp.]